MIVEHVIEHVTQQEKEVSGFLGGPQDTSLLTHYTHYVAYALWQGRVNTKLEF